ncbi:hypothetical protein L6164_024914 [Bauhinia variegata]|uniref:Uncharacterized protein n=1 Tax=Bauhinia variegata TaxID=167791 RepID=A0ACB9M0L9_BAUVA|nr:hypothetical protein L6164_024914 [Bauhinia variegata]
MPSFWRSYSKINRVPLPNKQEPKEEREPLLLLRQENSNQMAQKEVVVDFDGNYGLDYLHENSHASKRKEDSEEEEKLQQTIYSREEIPKFSRNGSFQGLRWRSHLNRTKSRLIDPPHESCASSDEVNNGRQPERKKDKDVEVDDVEDLPEEFKRIRFSLFYVLQWISLASILAALVSNLWVPDIGRLKLWDLPLWKWEIMILALICGRLVSGWVIKVVVFFVERNFILRKRVLYFVYGLKNAVKNCIWLGLVLLVLALSFHVKAFFQRIREALFKQYVIETLCGPPLIEHETEASGSGPSTPITSAGLQWNSTIRKSSKFSRSRSSSRKSKQQGGITIDQLDKLNRRNISAWNMKRMISTIRHGAFNTLDEQILNSDIEDESSQKIRSECQAKETAQKIFHNVAKTRYIFLEDVRKFMREDEALKTMDLLGAVSAEHGISKSSLRDWMVNAFRERRALALSLNDTKTAVDELHNILNILVAFIILIIWLVILGVPIRHFLVFLSSQVLLVVFMFGNTCKTVFEAIIFLFVMHPFDVGDRCEVDGVQMVVEEMNILTTVFLRYDNQKIIYPNSVLSTKPISNYQRSPDMGDIIDFCIHISTPIEKVSTMKERIIEYIERKNEHWHPEPMVIIRDVQDLNKLNMSVWLTHRMNFQDNKERWSRRTQLVEEMIKIFKQLDVEYRLLPLDVNVRYLPTLTSNRFPSTWTTFAA